MWLYSAALPTGGLLMPGRYLIRLYRYLFAFDPVTMTVGHIPAHELPGGIAAADRLNGRPGGPRTMSIILFLLLFFGLLAAGMPIFLVLGTLRRDPLSSPPASR